MNTIFCSDFFFNIRMVPTPFSSVFFSSHSLAFFFHMKLFGRRSNCGAHLFMIVFILLEKKTEKTYHLTNATIFSVYVVAFVSLLWIKMECALSKHANIQIIDGKKTSRIALNRIITAVNKKSRAKHQHNKIKMWTPNAERNEPWSVSTNKKKSNPFCSCCLHAFVIVVRWIAKRNQRWDSFFF